MYSTSTLNKMAVREQPQHRLSAVNSMTTEELLAVLIGGAHQLEIAREIVNQFGTLQNIMRLDKHELIEIKGVGAQCAGRIQAGLALGMRAGFENNDNPSPIVTPVEIVDLLAPRMINLTRETLWVVSANTRNVPINVEMLYSGTINSCAVRAAEVFQTAIKMSARAIFLAHNHPSNDPSPSPDDISMTRELVKAGKLLDIELLDHVIICSPSRWCSIKSTDNHIFM